MYHRGEGGPQSFAEARRLFGLAAAQDHANAQYSLSILHYRGEGGPQDSAEARRLLDIAASQGLARAQSSLAAMLLRGFSSEAEVDFAEARRLYELAAAQGHADAQYNLGLLYHQGKGAPHDLVQARRAPRRGEVADGRPAQL